ncbi:cytochrome P450 [Microdochium trichocladiopsis]|uniref:Cytochrome P450 n=1 Tax=Microdochium trichocladiopsis TaxID=1682393 RepID=A0A9P8YIY8_9PEZI|nr:cytochrome P450 [Microdochium trichocladiopsis]KAH7040883.1 cytochrome P450 [Microdochium trichocladiopsis]
MELSHNQIVLASGAATLSLALGIVLVKKLSRPDEFKVPLVGGEDADINALKLRYVREADVVLQEGYEKFRNEIFQVATPDGPRLFLPRRYAHDLKKYKRHEASGMKALADRHIGNYTTIDHESDIMLGAIKMDLNRNLGLFVGDVEEEIRLCFDTQFLPCDDWTPIDLHEQLLRVVAQASARIFVGAPLCRNDEWLECSTKFALDVMTGGEKLKQWSPWLRPVAQWFVPEMRRIHGDHQRARDLLAPELRRRRDEERAGVAVPRNDMIQWMFDRAKKTGDTSFDDKELANLQMLTATAAIHTTRLAIIHALYDLAAHPEYVEPLRQEIAAVRAEEGSPVLKKQTLTALRKLDSFMKESQRHSPPSVATFQRKAMVPITLSDGFHIPAGTIAQVNTNVLDETPAEWGDPHAFDGFRFYKLRTENNPEENSHKFQFVSPTYDSMQFGYGNDACPGRWFAGQQIKLVLAHILSNYDIKFADGLKERPKNFMFEVNVMADPSAVVLFKRIEKK